MPKNKDKQLNKLKLIGNFEKLWKFKKIEDKEIPQEEYTGYLDPSKVIMVIPKLESIRGVITDNFDVDKTDKIPNLNFDIQHILGSKDKLKVFARLEGTENKFDENSVKLSTELMKIVLKLCMNTKSESILFKFRKYYPLWVETKELIIILAPRVG